MFLLWFSSFHQKALKKTLHVFVTCMYFFHSTFLMAADLFESVSAHHPHPGMMDQIIFKDREYLTRNGEYFIFLDELLEHHPKSTQIQWVATEPKREILAEIDYIYENTSKYVRFSSKTDKPVYMVFRDSEMRLNLEQLNLFGSHLHLCCPLDTNLLSFQGKNLDIRNTCTAKMFICQGNGLLNFAHQGEKSFDMAYVYMDSFYNKTPLQIGGKFEANCPGEIDLHKKASIGHLELNAGKLSLKNDLEVSGDSAIKAKKILSTGESSLHSSKTLILNGDDVELGGNISVENLDISGGNFRLAGSLLVRKISSIHPENISFLDGSNYTALLTNIIGNYVFFNDKTEIQNGHLFSVFGKTGINSYTDRIQPVSSGEIGKLSSLTQNDLELFPAGIIMNGDGYGVLKGKITENSDISISIANALEMQLMPESRNLFIKTREGSAKGSLFLNTSSDGTGQNASISSAKDLDLLLGGKGGNISWKAGENAFIALNGLDAVVVQGDAGNDHQLSGEATAGSMAFHGENVHLLKESNLQSQIVSMHAEKEGKNSGNIKAGSLFLSTSQIFNNQASISAGTAIIHAGKSLINNGTATAERFFLNTGELRNNNEISGIKILTNDRNMFAEVCKNSNIPLANKDLVDTRYIENNKKISGGNTKLVSKGSIHNHDTIEASETLDIEAAKHYLNSIRAKTFGKNVMLDAGAITNILGLIKAGQSLVRKSYLDLNLGFGMAKNIQIQSLASLNLLPDIGVNVSNTSLVNLGGASVLSLNNSISAPFHAGFFSLGALHNSATALISRNFSHTGFFSNITAIQGVTDHIFSGKTSITAMDFVLGNNFSLIPKSVQQIGLKEVIKKGAGMAAFKVLNDFVMPGFETMVGKAKKWVASQDTMAPDFLYYGENGAYYLQKTGDFFSTGVSILNKTLPFLNGYASFPFKNRLDFARSYLDRFPCSSEIRAGFDFISRNEAFIFHPANGFLSMGTSMLVDGAIDGLFENVDFLNNFGNRFLFSGTYHEKGMQYGGGNVNFSRILVESRQMDSSIYDYNGAGITVTEDASLEKGITNLNGICVSLKGKDFHVGKGMKIKAGTAHVEAEESFLNDGSIDAQQTTINSKHIQNRNVLKSDTVVLNGKTLINNGDMEAKVLLSNGDTFRNEKSIKAGTAHVEAQESFLNDGSIDAQQTTINSKHIQNRNVLKSDTAILNGETVINNGDMEAKNLVSTGDTFRNEKSIKVGTAHVEASESFLNDGSIDAQQTVIDSKHIQNRNVLKSDTVILNGETVINNGDMEAKVLLSNGDTFRNDGNTSVSTAIIQATENFVNNGTAKAEYFLVNGKEIRNNNHLSGTKLLTNDRQTFEETCKNNDFPFNVETLVDTQNVENNKRISGENIKLSSSDSIHNNNTIEATENLELKAEKLYLNSDDAKTSGKNVILEANEILDFRTLLKEEGKLNATELLDIRTSQNIPVDENISRNHAVFLHGNNVYVNATQNSDYSRGFFAENGDLFYNASVNLNVGTDSVLYHGASGKIENDGHFIRAPYEYFDVKGGAKVINGALFKADIYMGGRIDGIIDMKPDIKYTCESRWYDEAYYNKYRYGVWKLEPKKKIYKVGGFEGGTGIPYTDSFGSERKVGLNMKMGELNNEASAIRAEADVIVTAEKINGKSNHNEFTNSYRDGKWGMRDHDYNLQKPEFSSKNGLVVLKTTNGDMLLEAANIEARDGVQFYSSGKVLFQNVLGNMGLVRLGGNGRDNAGQGFQRKDISHGATIKTAKGVYDAAEYLETFPITQDSDTPEAGESTPETKPSFAGNTEPKTRTLFKTEKAIKDGIPHVWMIGEEGIEGVDTDISTSLLITDGKYVNLKNAIMDQHVRFSSRGKTSSVYDIPLDHSGVPALLGKLDILKLKDLSKQQNFDQVATTLNNLATLLECKSIEDLVGMVLTPSIGINMSKKLIDHHYQTTGKGCIDTDFWVLKGKEYCYLELPALVRNDLFVDTPVFTQQGNILRQSLFIKEVSKRFSIGLGGIDFSRSKSVMKEQSANVKNQTLMVLGKIHLNGVQEWNMIAANTYCKDVKGGLPVMHVVSLQNDRQGSSKSNSIGLTGNFSSSKTRYHSKETVPSGITIQDDPKNFRLGLFRSRGGYLMIGTPSSFAPDEVLAESNIDSFSMSSKTMGGNFISIANFVVMFVISPQAAFLSGPNMINRPFYYSSSKKHQQFEHLTSLINTKESGKITGTVNRLDLNSARRQITSKKSQKEIHLITINAEKGKTFVKNIGEMREKLDNFAEKHIPSDSVTSFNKKENVNKAISKESVKTTENKKSIDHLLAPPRQKNLGTSINQDSHKSENICKSTQLTNITIDENDQPLVCTATDINDIMNPVLSVLEYPTPKDEVYAEDARFYNIYPSICEPLNTAVTFKTKNNFYDHLKDMHSYVCVELNTASAPGSSLKPFVNVLEILPFGSALMTSCDPESTTIDVAQEVLFDLLALKGAGNLVKKIFSPASDINNFSTNSFSSFKDYTGFKGQKGFEMKNPKYQPKRNKGTLIGGREYSGHALDQMQNRGIYPSCVENTLSYGEKFKTKEGTIGYYDKINEIKVIVSSETSKIVTVIRGKP